MRFSATRVKALIYESARYSRRGEAIIADPTGESTLNRGKGRERSRLCVPTNDATIPRRIYATKKPFNLSGLTLVRNKVEHAELEALGCAPRGLVLIHRGNPGGVVAKKRL